MVSRFDARPASRPDRRLRRARRRTRSSSPPTGRRRPRTAASTRPWPTAPTGSTAWTSTIQPGGPQVNNRPLLPAGPHRLPDDGQPAAQLRQREERRAHDRRRRDVPEGSAGADRPSRPGLREVRGAEECTGRADRQGRAVQLVAVAKGRRTASRTRRSGPTTTTSAPFLANPKSIQQGYSVAEPIYVENQGKFKPIVHLLADHGFSTYSTVIEARAGHGEGQAGAGAALRRRLDPRLGQLPLRRPQGRERDDDQGQPRDDARPRSKPRSR